MIVPRARRRDAMHHIARLHPFSHCVFLSPFPCRFLLLECGPLPHQPRPWVSSFSMTALGGSIIEESGISPQVPNPGTELVKQPPYPPSSRQKGGRDEGREGKKKKLASLCALTYGVRSTTACLRSMRSSVVLLATALPNKGHVCTYEAASNPHLCRRHQSLQRAPR